MRNKLTISELRTIYVPEAEIVNILVIVFNSLN